MNLTESQIKDLQLQKENTQKLVNTLTKVQQHIKKKPTKSRKVIKTAEDFIKCNITNPVIYTKLNKLKQIIEECSHANNEN